MKHQLILDVMTLPVLGLFFLTSYFNPWSQGYLGSLLGMALGGGVMVLIAYASKGGMGGGDIKLSGAMGAFLGPSVMGAIMTAFFLGAIVSMGLLVLNYKTRKDLIPFGPFLATGGFLTMLWRTEMVGVFDRYILGN